MKIHKFGWLEIYVCFIYVVLGLKIEFYIYIAK